MKGQFIDLLKVEKSLIKNTSFNPLIFPLIKILNSGKSEETSKIPSCYTTQPVLTEHYIDYYNVDYVTGEMYYTGTVFVGTSVTYMSVSYPCESGNGDEIHIVHSVPNYNYTITDSICNTLKQQNNNSNFKAKIEELQKKTSEKKESGYTQQKDGTYISATTSTSNNNTDALNVTINNNTVGFIHTHLNDYETGNFNANGDPELRMPIRMFSPHDIDVFMDMVDNAQTNGIPLDNLYGTMVSSDGNYTIKFTGTSSDIKTDFDTKKLNEEFSIFFREESGSKEKLFLRFLSEKMGLKGVSLYKIKSDGTAIKKELSSTGKLISINCI